jgi:hypothetical protein
VSEWLTPFLTLVAIFVSSVLWAALWLTVVDWWRKRHDA